MFIIEVDGPLDVVGPILLSVRQVFRLDFWAGQIGRSVVNGSTLLRRFCETRSCVAQALYAAEMSPPLVIRFSVIRVNEDLILMVIVYLYVKKRWQEMQYCRLLVPTCVCIRPRPACNSFIHNYRFVYIINIADIFFYFEFFKKLIILCSFQLNVLFVSFFTD